MTATGLFEWKQTRPLSFTSLALFASFGIPTVFPLEYLGSPTLWNTYCLVHIESLMWAWLHCFQCTEEQLTLLKSLQSPHSVGIGGVRQRRDGLQKPLAFPPLPFCRAESIKRKSFQESTVNCLYSVPTALSLGLCRRSDYSLAIPFSPMSLFWKEWGKKYHTHQAQDNAHWIQWQSHDCRMLQKSYVVINGL